MLQLWRQVSAGICVPPQNALTASRLRGLRRWKSWVDTWSGLVYNILNYNQESTGMRKHIIPAFEQDQHMSIGTENDWWCEVIAEAGGTMGMGGLKNYLIDRGWVCVIHLDTRYTEARERDWFSHKLDVYLPKGDTTLLRLLLPSNSEIRRCFQGSVSLLTNDSKNHNLINSGLLDIYRLCV